MIENQEGNNNVFDVEDWSDKYIISKPKTNEADKKN
jgi:hypothetical protein